MPKMIVVKSQTPPPQTDWFLSKGGGAVYKRGENGLCIDAKGNISEENYGGALAEVFTDPRNGYIPLHAGDQIVITL